MTEAGFVNYPLEWWHWSYGDKYWARVSAATAVYGDVAEEPRTWRRRLARLLSGATRRVP
jgi:D-alanyl-D-alanine dipeptidase